MAVIKPESDPLNTNKKPTDGNKILNPGGGGSFGGGGSATKPTSSGQWTNLQQYRDANKGAPEKMAGLVKDNINQAGDNIRSGITSADDKYDKQSGLYRGARSIIGEGTGGALPDKPSWSTPSIDNNISEYEKRVANTTGSSGIYDEVNRLHTPQGTAGMKALDQFIVQSSPESLGVLNEVRDEAPSLREFYNQTTADNTAAANQSLQAMPNMEYYNRLSPGNEAMFTGMKGEIESALRDGDYIRLNTAMSNFNKKRAELDALAQLSGNSPINDTQQASDVDETLRKYREQQGL